MKAQAYVDAICCIFYNKCIYVYVKTGSFVLACIFRNMEFSAYLCISITKTKVSHLLRFVSNQLKSHCGIRGSGSYTHGQIRHIRSKLLRWPTQRTQQIVLIFQRRLVDFDSETVTLNAYSMRSDQSPAKIVKIDAMANCLKNSLLTCLMIYVTYRNQTYKQIRKKYGIQNLSKYRSALQCFNMNNEARELIETFLEMVASIFWRCENAVLLRSWYFNPWATVSNQELQIIQSWVTALSGGHGENSLKNSGKF